MDIDKLCCPVCKSGCQWLDVVDFNKSCEELRGKFLPLAGLPVYYAQCGYCGFCFAPEMCGWSLEVFSERVYNHDYPSVDPDYLDARPRANAAMLAKMFTGFPATHLDYGGGNGLLSALLRDVGWASVSYDPFVDRAAVISSTGRFDLITAFEVFEHVPDVQALMGNLCSLLAPNGIILFSTLLSDGNIQPNRRLSWWYAAPRNGHISLFSSKSLEILARQNGFNFGSFSKGLHIFFKNSPPPDWATHVIKKK